MMASLEIAGLALLVALLIAVMALLVRDRAFDAVDVMVEFADGRKGIYPAKVDGFGKVVTSVTAVRTCRIVDAKVRLAGVEHMMTMERDLAEVRKIVLAPGDTAALTFIINPADERNSPC